MKWKRVLRVAAVVAGCVLWRGPHDAPGISLAFFWAAIPAAVSLVSAYLASRQGSKYPPYQPPIGQVRAYGADQAADIARLRGPNPFAGSDLGYGQNVMEAAMAPGTDEAAAEYQSELGQINQAAATGGSPLSLSGAVFRAKQRALEGSLGRITDVRRRNLIADAVQRRQDLYNRLGEETTAYGQAASLYSAGRQQKVAAATAPYQAVSDVAAGLAAGGTTQPNQSITSSVARAAVPNYDVGVPQPSALPNQARQYYYPGAPMQT